MPDKKHSLANHCRIGTRPHLPARTELVAGLETAATNGDALVTGEIRGQAGSFLVGPINGLDMRDHLPRAK